MKLFQSSPASVRKKEIKQSWPLNIAVLSRQLLNVHGMKFWLKLLTVTCHLATYKDQGNFKYPARLFLDNYIHSNLKNHALVSIIATELL